MGSMRLASTWFPGWLRPVIFTSFLVTTSVGCQSTEASPSDGAAQSVSVIVAPSTDTLFTLQSKQLAAEVTGTARQLVNWTVEPPGCGSVTDSGLFTAPAVAATCTVRATSQLDREKSGTATLMVVSVPTSTVPLGVNVQGIADYERQHFFADIVKQGRPWSVIGNPNSLVALDADGWPTANAMLVAITGDPQPGTAGTYKLTAQGNWLIGLDTPLGAASVANRVYDPSTNRTTADLVVGSDVRNVWPTFTATGGQTGGPKDVKILRPGHAFGELFSRDFLARIAPFRALRFMQWMGPPSRGVNGQTDRTWSERNLPGYALQAGAALPPRPGEPSNWYFAPRRSPAWEWIVLLANQVQKDVWITLPFFADDDYITKVAQLFRYGSDGVNPYTSPQANPVYPPLHSNLKLYVEFCNELWNDTYLTTEVNYNSVPMAWAPSTSYNIGWSQTGQRVKVGTGAAANVYELTAVNGVSTGYVAGTSGNVAPSGTATFQDNTLTWTWRGTVASLKGWQHAANLDYTGGGNRSEQGWRKVGYHAVRQSLLFRAVFGSEMMTRVRPVLATQLVRYATSTMPLEYIATVWGGTEGQVNAYGKEAHPVSYYIYGIAGAPYLPTGNGSLDPSSADTLLNGAVANWNNPGASYNQAAITWLGSLAGSHGIRALSYEGGTNFIPERMPGWSTEANRPAMLQAARGANLSPRIDSELITPMLRHWYATPNAELFMYYTLAARWDAGGAWGLSDDITSEATPKWDAIKRMASAK